MPFQPVTQVRGSRQVMEQIKQSILDGVYRPGESLPSHSALAEQFGVSRTTIREAVQSLASLGFLEIRQGIGTLVSSHATTLEDPALWLPWLTEHKEDVMALLDVREALEVKAAVLAAQAVARGAPETAKHLREMEHSLEEMARAAEFQDTAALERWDLEFHASLAQAADNSYLLRLARSINHVWADRRAVMAMPGRAALSLAEHAEVLKAVRAADSAAAAAAVARHLGSAKAAVAQLRGDTGVSSVGGRGQ